MGQSDIIKLLEKKSDYVSGKEIAKELGGNEKNIFNLLSKLIDYGEIIFIEIDREEARLRYNSKIRKRMRLYKIADNY